MQFEKNNISNGVNLSIIIVSWNVKEKLKDNLRALYQSAGDFSFEVFVIDNNSADGTAEMVKNDYPKVKLIVNQENLGFARANNQALRLCSPRPDFGELSRTELGTKAGLAEYVLLLNPDTKVFTDTLEKMINWLDNNSQAAVAGCKLIDESGGVIKQVRRFPALFNQLAIVFKIPHIWPKALAKYIPNDFDYGKAAVVDSIRGSFFMVRHETLAKIGLLDERFFVWFEEVDYCRRVKQAGLEVWYTPAAECLDMVGASFLQLSRGQAQKYFRDSQLAYFKKWQPSWQYCILKLAWPVGLAIAWLGEKLEIKRRIKF